MTWPRPPQIRAGEASHILIWLLQTKRVRVNDRPDRRGSARSIGPVSRRLQCVQRMQTSRPSVAISSNVQKGKVRSMRLS